MSATLRIATTLTLGLTLGLALAAAPGVAAAGPRTTDHVTRTIGPVVFDAPAGAGCDFAYHEEASGTQNLTRFFDGDGTLIRVEDQVTVTVQHQNVDTGYTLTETDRYAAFVDFVTGEATTSGQNWHLVDEDGRLVLSGAGQFTLDLTTGELLDETPHMKTDFAGHICAALGGAPSA